MQANMKKLSMSQSHQSVFAASPPPAAPPPGPPGGDSPPGSTSIHLLSTNNQTVLPTVLTTDKQTVLSIVLSTDNQTVLPILLSSDGCALKQLSLSPSLFLSLLGLLRSLYLIFVMGCVCFSSLFWYNYEIQIYDDKDKKCVFN